MRGAIEKNVIQFDEVGLLKNPDMWNENIARQIALQDGMGELTEAHWKVIFSLRESYAQDHVPPAIDNRNLFPCCMEAWRVAGIPDPERNGPSSGARRSGSSDAAYRA